jgi:hypothetical protein
MRLSDQPILKSGHGWFGPGGESAPVIGPDGQTYLLYHGAKGPNPRHVSGQRYLLLSQLGWEGLGGYFPLINDGRAG